MEAKRQPGQNRTWSKTMQAIGDTKWLQMLELAQQAADLPECDRLGVVTGQGLDAEKEKLVLELAADFEPDPEFGVGSQLGRYVATREIARGGTSQIFAATDEELGRKVALKVLNNEDIGDADALAWLLKEARAASALSHPNIVTIYEVVRAGRLSALAMEYVPGKLLRSMMCRPLGFRECLPIWRQVARALEATHAAGIAHRDVKPENIMVRPDGLVKLLDFGMTRSSTQDHEWEETTGTPRYMSPEQCRSFSAGVETDIFSLGVVFYEMITGHHPFEGGSAWDTMTSIVEEAPEPPSKWNPAISRQLDALILCMLKKQPADRPGAAAVVETLDYLAPTEAGVTMPWLSWASRALQSLRSILSAAARNPSNAIPTPLLD